MRITKSELRFIQRTFSKLFLKLTRQSYADVISIPIKQCRHYCGFRYASNSFNPYENYVVGLHQRVPKEVLRERFEDFLMYYRPRNFGEVLNIEFSNHIPLWVYPWRSGDNFDPQNAWLEDIDSVPDILTHFCEKGIKRSRIEEEYFWLERAYATISSKGYRPAEFSYIDVFELKDNEHSVYVLKDGNHRLSAMVALGYQEVVVKRVRHERVNCKNYRNWPQVRRGLYSEGDALHLVNVYFTGVDGFRPASQPAVILEHQ